MLLKSHRCSLLANTLYDQTVIVSTLHTDPKTFFPQFPHKLAMSTPNPSPKTRNPFPTNVLPRENQKHIPPTPLATIEVEATTGNR